MTNARHLHLQPPNQGAQDGPVLFAVNRFGRYKTEDARPERKIILEETATTRRIIRAWEMYLSTDFFEPQRNPEIVSEVEKAGHDANDVRRFSLSLCGYQKDSHFPEKSGFFLSLLMNRCPDTSFIIETRHIEQRIDNLGFDNDGKIINVNGDVGDNAGLKMRYRDPPYTWECHQ